MDDDDGLTWGLPIDEFIAEIDAWVAEAVACGEAWPPWLQDDNGEAPF